MGSCLLTVTFYCAFHVALADVTLDATEAGVDITTASVKGLLSRSGVSVLSWHSVDSVAPPPELLDSVFPGMGLLGLDLDDEATAPTADNAANADSQEDRNAANADSQEDHQEDDDRWKVTGVNPPALEANAIATNADSQEDREAAEEVPMTMAERLKRLRAHRVAEAEGMLGGAVAPASGGGEAARAVAPASGGGEASDPEAKLLFGGEWASAADVDSRSNYSQARPNRTLDVAKIAWLHFPKAGTSFANTLVSWGCPRLNEDDIVDNRTADGSGAYIWGFMGTHKKQCHEEFSICGGHAPIKEGGCNAWEKHSGNFVALFRQPEQRIISGFNQNCHDISGDNCTITGYAKKVSGCSVKMMNGQDCGADVAVTADMVSTAIQRLDTGFAFVGLTEQWALSVCLFHAMFGGQCHDREFLNVRPGKKHAVMRYDTQGLEGWTDAYDGAVYTHASMIFRNNIARYGVSPDTCRQNFCSNSVEAFEMALFSKQR